MKISPPLTVRITDICRKEDRGNRSRQVVGAGAFRSYDGGWYPGRGDGVRACRSVGRVGKLLFLFCLAGLLLPAELHAQAAASKSDTATQPAPDETVPLGRYVLKENLILYIEFEGLNAHAASWQN